MTFLEARKLTQKAGGFVQLPFLMAMSGTPDELGLYLRAHAAKVGFEAQPDFLPFGTLAQALHQAPDAGKTELFLLMPWDLAPECDWRLGVEKPADLASILSQAERNAQLISARPNAVLAYLPAVLPPIFASEADNARIGPELAAIAARLGARALPADLFAMSSYLATGCPFSGRTLSGAAEALIELLARPPAGALKVLATDADNTLWAGLVGEDGPDSVAAEANGSSFRHFIYQTMLKRLKEAGILLALVSRNDPDIVEVPLASGRMVLSQTDFVALKAGYGAKSDHLRELAKSLNVGIDSILFVDDNPVELAEIGAALPSVRCLAFPRTDEELAPFLVRLSRLFDRTALTDEDRSRTELYRRRQEILEPADRGGLEDFLKSLAMEMIVTERTGGNWARAHQLINKTNQFNLNGLRLSGEDLASVLEAGGRLFTARLKDRTGDHGEILACLIGPDGLVRTLVLSCRVFQRRVEHSFLLWLAANWTGPDLSFDFRPTERNEPARLFFVDQAFAPDGDRLAFDKTRFAADHGADAGLFELHFEDS